MSKCNFQGAVLLDEELFDELRTVGSITVDGFLIRWEDGVICLVPELDELTAKQLNAKIVALQQELETLQEATSEEAVFERDYPVGIRYFQFPGMPTPEERFKLGTWILDDDATDKFLVGAGNLYALGATGGSTAHTHGSGTLTAHITIRGNSGSSDADEDLIFEEQKTDNIWNADNYSKTALGYSTTTGDEITTNFGVAVSGTTASANNLPPYLAVNIWKREA